MRQVPQYAVIGNGRMAQHMCHYLENLGVNFQRWFRAQHSQSQLHSILLQSTHVLILISDSAIEDFVADYIGCQFPDLIRIHFSGCLVTSCAFSAHPLQSFTSSLYELEDYQRMPFVIDDNAPDFSALLPGLTNPHYRLSKSDKPYYHALCVLANNFSTLLWEKYFKEMQQRFGIQSTHLMPYLQQTFKNIQANPETALTGPIQRK